MKSIEQQSARRIINTVNNLDTLRSEVDKAGFEAVERL
jgi:hypothetical protein